MLSVAQLKEMERDESNSTPSYAKSMQLNFIQVFGLIAPEKCVQITKVNKLFGCL